jgi:hypothetical protein
MMKTQIAHSLDNVHPLCNDVYVEMCMHKSRTAEHLLFTTGYCGIDPVSLSRPAKLRGKK